MPKIIIIAHNIRSTHNIGSIFRTSEGFGVEKIILSGYSPYPEITGHDSRLPHLRQKITEQIHKTALGAETMVDFEYQETPDLQGLRQQGYSIVGLEQTRKSINLSAFQPPDKIVIILGEEVHGISQALINQCDTLVEIPMKGQKESFNVSVACGILLYAIISQ